MWGVILFSCWEVSLPTPGMWSHFSRGGSEFSKVLSIQDLWRFSYFWVESYKKLVYTSTEWDLIQSWCYSIADVMTYCKTYLDTLDKIIWFRRFVVMCPMNAFPHSVWQSAAKVQIVLGSLLIFFFLEIHPLSWEQACPIAGRSGRLCDNVGFSV